MSNNYRRAALIAIAVFTLGVIPSYACPQETWDRLKSEVDQASHDLNLLNNTPGANIDNALAQMDAAYRAMQQCEHDETSPPLTPHTIIVQPRIPHNITSGKQLEYMFICKHQTITTEKKCLQAYFD